MACSTRSPTAASRRIEGITVKLSPTWRRVWRRYSFNAMGWGLGFLAWWESDAAPDLKAAIGVQGALLILAALLALGMVGSVLDQPKTRNPEPRKDGP